MEVVPTGDGDDDGVIWFRCPQCQGFLPKLGGGDPEPGESLPDGSAESKVESAPPPVEGDKPSGGDMPWDSPADMIAARTAEPQVDPESDVDPDVDPDLDPDDVLLGGAVGDDSESAPFVVPADRKDDQATKEPQEPIGEYATQLAGVDAATAVPYRPWESYEVGQCIHHLAWDDFGIVVAKEDLPGGRKVVKCYFGEAGVVRLIEEAPR